MIKGKMSFKYFLKVYLCVSCLLALFITSYYVPAIIIITVLCTAIFINQLKERLKKYDAKLVYKINPKLFISGGPFLHVPVRQSESLLTLHITPISNNS